MKYYYIHLNDIPYTGPAQYHPEFDCKASWGVVFRLSALTNINRFEYSLWQSHNIIFFEADDNIPIEKLDVIINHTPTYVFGWGAAKLSPSIISGMFEHSHVMVDSLRWAVEASINRALYQSIS